MRFRLEAQVDVQIVVLVAGGGVVIVGVMGVEVIVVVVVQLLVVVVIEVIVMTASIQVGNICSHADGKPCKGC